MATRALGGDGHTWRTYDLTGPAALTRAEITAQIGAAVGRPVTLVDVPGAAMREAALAAGLPPWQADGLVDDDAHYARGEAADVSPEVEAVTGRPARSFAAFAREHAAAFAAGQALAGHA